jgi:hypothetical protein
MKLEKKGSPQNPSVEQIAALEKEEAGNVSPTQFSLKKTGKLVLDFNLLAGVSLIKIDWK